MYKNSFLTNVIEEVRKLNIVDIVKGYINIEKSKAGNHYALCPFHKDNNIGSFIISESKNRAKCFACGQASDSIKIVAKVTNLSYSEAAMKIALDYSIVTSVEYDNFINGKINKDREIETFKTKIKKTEIKKEKEKEKHDNRKLDIIYNTFLDLLSLDDEHRKILKEKRKLSDEEIEERKYKTLETQNVDFSHLMKELNKKEEFKEIKEEEILKRVPGFFQKKVNGRWVWKHYNKQGLLIPIRNAKNEITALQVRKNKKDRNGVRYVWFSSSFAYKPNNSFFRYGTKSSIEIDVLYPEKTPSKGLFITEGRFKSEAITSKLGATSISVQGIYGYKGIEKVIKEIKEETKKKFKDFKGYKNICIAFDSELSTNKNIYKAMKIMSDKIQEKNKEENIFYISWDEKYKGIDDLLFSEESKNVEDYHKLISVYKKKN